VGPDPGVNAHGRAGADDDVVSDAGRWRQASERMDGGDELHAPSLQFLGEADAGEIVADRDDRVADTGAAEMLDALAAALDGQAGVDLAVPCRVGIEERDRVIAARLLENVLYQRTETPGTINDHVVHEVAPSLFLSVESTATLGRYRLLG